MQEAQHQTKTPVDSLVPGRFQPRSYFDPKEMEELIDSIRAQGVLQPILARPLADGKFEIIAGERRWRASKVAGLTEVPTMIREMSDEEAQRAAATENIIRANMSPAEEAEAIARELAACNGDRDEAAKRFGLSRETLDKRLALMNCSEKVRQTLSERKISLGHAELLAAVHKDKQDAILDKILTAPKLPTVAEMKAQLEAIAKPLADVVFDKTECASCQHNSGNQKALFGEAISDGNCTNGSCYDGKTEAALQAKVDEIKDDYPTVKIVRPGDNFLVVKLDAAGPAGVGEEQAKACRGCAKFGAAVSAVPGKVGKVSKDLCFDPSCNQKKVAERIKAEQGETGEEGQATQQAGTGKASTGGKTAKAGKTAKKKAKAAEVSQRTKDYRVKVWRQALKKELMTDRERNLNVLIAIGLSGLGRDINQGVLEEAFQKLTGAASKDSYTFHVGQAVQAVAAADQKVRDTMLMGLAASATKGIEERYLVDLLKTLGVDMTKHWTLNEEFLGLLTKSEIEAVADEIGLKAHIGEKEFSKAVGGKKDEAIKHLLATEGFSFEGKVPAVMLFEP